MRDFKPSEYREKMSEAKKQTDKAKRILRWFGSLDILVCHQPPHGILDEVTSRSAPKSWIGKRAGSKAILQHIMSKPPRYVFCGHIHEGQGMERFGGTEVHNLGVGGYKIVEF